MPPTVMPPTIRPSTPVVVVQAGTNLYKLTRFGTYELLTIPDGIVISDQTPPRFGVFGDYVVIVNSPSRPVSVDLKGTVRPLSPIAPANPLIVATGGSGALTGDYKARYTYAILDTSGNIIAESDYSPESAAVTLSSDKLQAKQVNVSIESSVNVRRLYRTTAGGDVYFGWISLDGNVLTTITDDVPDAGLQLTAAPTLGTAPGMVLIAEFKGRLFGVPRDDVNNLIFCQAGEMYAWPATNLLTVPGAGWSDRGITSLLPRKEALGVGRPKSLYQITGSDSTSFRPVVVHDKLGVVSHESVAIWNDTALFLSDEGVCAWDANGVRIVSDGKVRSWFTGDNYFNRAMWPRSFAFINPQRKTYQLFLCGAGSPIINRWVEYDLRTGKWWGPHKTTAFNPTSGLLMPDQNDLIMPMVGSFDGHMWREHSGAYDNVSTAIELDVKTKEYDRGAPDLHKFWGEMSMLGKSQAAAGTLKITPSLGDTASALVAGDDITYAMARGRQRLRRLGAGIVMQLRFHGLSAINKPVELNGFEVPGHILGRR